MQTSRPTFLSKNNFEMLMWVKEAYLWNLHKISCCAGKNSIYFTFTFICIWFVFMIFLFFLYDLLLRHLMRTFSCYPCLKAAAVLILIPIIYFHYQRLEYVVKCHCQSVLWVDDITANDAIQRNQHLKTKKINLTSIVITDVKLTS